MTTKAGEILWVSAKEALFMAFLVSILGSIAISILSGICGGMTPSLPPGLEGHPALTSVPAHWWHASQNAIHRHAFAILFLVLFVVKAALRMAHYSSNPLQRKAAARMLWATHRISRDWFSFLIKNAFWLLYSAGLCDDLGLPNYKTLARRAGKRFCKAIPRWKVTRDVEL
jgi:hypothetical protein